MSARSAIDDPAIGLNGYIPRTYNCLYVELSCDYYFTKKLGVFASFRNLTGEVQDVGLRPEHARGGAARIAGRRDLGVWPQGSVLITNEHE